MALLPPAIAASRRRSISALRVRQAVGFVVNEALMALFQGLVAELHDEELTKIGEVHFQEVVLLEILEFGTNGKELD